MDKILVVLVSILADKMAKESKLILRVIFAIGVLFAIEYQSAVDLVLVPLGIIISPFVVNITQFLVYQTVCIPFWGLEVSENNIIYAIQEEIVWRDLPLFFLHDFCHIYIFITMLLESLAFVYMHKVKGVRKNIEMVLFSFLLLVSALFLPGLNWGIHIGRNCYIDYINKKRDKNEYMQN